MTLELRLPADVESRLRQQAEAAGEPLESFLIHLLRGQLTGATPASVGYSARSTAERLAFLDAIAARHAPASHPADARRDTIYVD